MNDLREGLQELAEAAARHGQTRGPQAALRQGRRRRLRLAGGTATLLALVLLATMVGANRLTSRPGPMGPTPAAGSTPWIPSVTPLQVNVHSGPYPGPYPGGKMRNVASFLQVCKGATGKPEVRAWARVLGKWWLLAAKPTPPGKALCWADSFLQGNGTGTVGLHGGPWEPLKPLQVGGGSTGVAGKQQLGVVSGTVTKRAVRLRVLFHKGRPLDLKPVAGGNRFPVNFFAGFYLETGPPPTEHKRREPAIDGVIALDQAGNRVAECRLRFGPGNTTTPWRCRPTNP